MGRVYRRCLKLYLYKKWFCMWRVNGMPCRPLLGVYGTLPRNIIGGVLNVIIRSNGDVLAI